MTRSYPNGLTRFTTPRFTLSDITPLTYRDGESYASLLWRLFRHITEVLNPSIEASFRELITQLEAEMAKAEEHYVDGVQEFQRIHDAFMADVNAHLMALNDSAVSDLVNDDTSMLGETLRSIFPDKATLDTELTNFRSDVNTSLSNARSDMNNRLDDFQTVIDRLHDEVFDDVSSNNFARLYSGSTVIAMVGSSTTRVGEYPYELSRHIKNKYRGGLFVRLDNLNDATLDNPPPGLHVINAGWGGSWANNYVDTDIASRISRMNPSVIIHGIGSNDWLHQRPPETVANDIDRAINMFTSSKPIYHVLVHQHSRTNVPASNPYTWDMYLDALHDVASRGERRIVVNTVDKLAEMGVGPGRPDHHNLMGDDGVHLTVAGQHVLGAIVANELGFDTGAGQTDTGWRHLGDFGTYHPNTGPGTNEPMKIRIISDSTGTTTYIRGLMERTGTNEGLFTISPRYRKLIIPNMEIPWGAADRHVIGTWISTQTDRLRMGYVFTRSETGGIVLSDLHGDAGDSSVWLNIVIRS